MITNKGITQGGFTTTDYSSGRNNQNVGISNIGGVRNTEVHHSGNKVHFNTGATTGFATSTVAPVRTVSP